MNKKQLAILERAWEAEINSAVNDGTPLIQTKSKIAAQLAESGHLEYREIILGRTLPVVIKGYQITHAGIYAYCQSLPDGLDVKAMEREMKEC